MSTFHSSIKEHIITHIFELNRYNDAPMHGFPPRKEWNDYPDYEIGELILVSMKLNIRAKYRGASGRILQYHPTSGVYTVYLEESEKEIVLHKTEMSPRSR